MGLAVPAIFFLESTKPLSYIGSQVLVFLEPFVKSVLTLASYDRFVALVEDRANVEKLLRRIEEMDEEAREREKEEKKRAKAENRQAQEVRAANQAARRAAGLPGELPRWRRILGRVRSGRRDTGE
jgi:ABC-type Zn2+ transport system substrate-binding protein/surface adhesin